MSGGRDRRRREPVYWWNDDIAECRRDCIRARRYAQRVRGRSDEVIRREEFADARRRLRNAIKASKRLCWRQFCDEADRDVWSKPYRTVMSRLKAPRTSPPTAPDLVRRAVSTLFPSVIPRLIGAPPVLEEHLIPEVGVEELRWAYRRLRIGAAPGPDGIPNTALKAAVEACFDSFRRVFTACLREGCFPARWKRQRPVLMLKPGKPAAEPSSYRPLCMLDTVGKILERIMVGRLEAHTEGPAGLADSQFGFRKRRSTVDAIQTVLSTARSAISGKRWHRGTKKYCAIVTLDVNNVFNSARWDKIFTALSQMEVPDYLQRMVFNYFRGRVLEFTTDDGAETYEVTAGVPQGSVLGPILWNVMYDRILRLELPRSAKIVGFADDIAITVVAKHLDLVEYYSNETVRLERAALTELGLQTADQKTEVLLVTSRKVTETITVRAGDHYITSAPCIRYLGVHIDTRLRFEEHLRIVSDKANRVAAPCWVLCPTLEAQGAVDAGSTPAWSTRSSYTVPRHGVRLRRSRATPVRRSRFIVMPACE
uniref:Reverse transcriptase domain-containing protein n=1 Tax=Trichogramma kaykai TaxID=54128 RepID=A0ABD2W1D4_9HYME